MPRPKLVRVSQSINGCLPKALQIACDDDVEDVDIRRAIEVLVGIRTETGSSAPSVPGAPRAVRTKSMSALVDDVPWDMDIDSSATDDRTIVIPSSPLAMRRPRLEMLKEEKEQDGPSKKRRRASPENVHTPPGRVSTASGSRLLESLHVSASPLFSSDSSEDVRSLTRTRENVQRRRSARLSGRNPHPREVVIRLPFASLPKAQPARLLRSHSQRPSILSTSAQVSTLKHAQSKDVIKGKSSLFATLERPLEYHLI